MNHPDTRSAGESPWHPWRSSKLQSLAENAPTRLEPEALEGIGTRVSLARPARLSRVRLNFIVHSHRQKGIEIIGINKPNSSPGHGAS